MSEYKSHVVPIIPIIPLLGEFERTINVILSSGNKRGRQLVDKYTKRCVEADKIRENYRDIPDKREKLMSEMKHIAKICFLSAVPNEIIDYRR